jgi:hypothetical protein
MGLKKLMYELLTRHDIIGMILVCVNSTFQYEFAIFIHQTDAFNSVQGLSVNEYTKLHTCSIQFSSVLQVTMLMDVPCSECSNMLSFYKW